MTTKSASAPVLPMNRRIQQDLARVAQEEGVRIHYACESGSRAWGFASADSEYEVRFLYARPAS